MGYRVEANPFEEAVSQSRQAREVETRKVTERATRRNALWDAAHEEGMTTIERLRDVVTPALVVIEDGKPEYDLRKARDGSVLIKVYQRGDAFEGFRPERRTLGSWISWDAERAEASPDGHGWRLQHAKPEHGSTLEALLLDAVRHPDFAEELVKLRADPPDPPAAGSTKAEATAHQASHEHGRGVFFLVAILLTLVVAAALAYRFG